MEWNTAKQFLLFLEHAISFVGILIIISGLLVAMYQYFIAIFLGEISSKQTKINDIRLSLGRIFLLGLEFIVAADIMSTIITPDYYAVGITAIIVIIRTILTFSINRELTTLQKEISA